MRRWLCLLLVLMLPCCAMAEEPFLTRFDLGFSAWHILEDELLLGLSEGLSALRLTGDLAADGGHFDLHVTLRTEEKTLTTARLFGTENQVFLESPLLGETRLQLDMPGLLEFALKMDRWLGLPVEAAALLWPYVTLNAWRSVAVAYDRLLTPHLAGEDIPVAALIDLVDEVEALRVSDSRLFVWLEAVSRETALSDKMDACLSLARAMLEAVPPETLLTRTVDAEGTCWQSPDGELKVTRYADRTEIWLTQTADDGVYVDSLFLTLGDAGATTLFQLQQLTGTAEGDDDFLLSLTSWQEAGVKNIALRMNGEAFAGLPLPVYDGDTLRFLPCVDAGRVYVSIDENRLTLAMGRQEDEPACVLVEVSCDLKTFPGTALNLPDVVAAVPLFSLNEETLPALVAEIAQPLLTGLIPILAELPHRTVAALVTLLEQVNLKGMED